MIVDRIGQQFGNYRLLRSLGQGGFAEVYLGEHVHLGSRVAVKVLHTRLIEREQEQFLREARTIASLDHPAIVRVLDCGVEHGVPFLIMTYAPYGSLRQLYPKGKRLPMSDILAYASSIASALSYAHHRKLIHRDIKPENILLGPRKEVLLSDFGIAVISSSSTSQSAATTAGTMAYMAPEQIMGKARAASDQYALGIMIYEWLCGELPFQGTFLEVCTQHLYAPPPPLSEKGITAAPALEKVVLKALAKEPAARFASIQEFAEALVSPACSDDGDEWVCKLTLTASGPTPGRLKWSMAISGDMAGVSTDILHGRLSVGQSRELTIYVPDTSSDGGCSNASFVFSGSFATVTVPWTCSS